MLFGTFLVWAVADLRSSYARDRRNAVTYPAPNWGATIGASLFGAVIWIALLGGLHLQLFWQVADRGCLNLRWPIRGEEVLMTT
jgi:NnrU protein